MPQLDLFEIARLKIQRELDQSKNQAERNRLGQFATPTDLATEILQYAKTLIPSGAMVKFLDPAFGTGAFYSALLRVFPTEQIESAVGYEIDPLYAQKTNTLWGDTLLDLRIEDFTKSTSPETEESKANLVICNPPYVRHHHLSSQYKIHLQAEAIHKTGIRVNGLTGLYCYFLLISHSWLAPDAIAGWLIPTEFMDVNYGKQVKDYLLNQVTLIRIHRFDPNEVQFEDALVSSAVVWIKNISPPDSHVVKFTYGGSLAEPKISRAIPIDHLRNVAKWTSLTNKIVNEQPISKVHLSDLFQIKRGLATGANEFFILSPDQLSQWELPEEFVAPILPSPRYLQVQKIENDSDDNPLLDQKLFLLNCNLPESHVQQQYPDLWKYFEHGKSQNIHERYLCRNRSPWYAQEQRLPSPFLCTYMGRISDQANKPFRFILNKSRAIATNVYLMLYPKEPLRTILRHDPDTMESVWTLLSQISADFLIGEGRIYGGGLHKIEPKELGNVPADAIIAWLKDRMIDFSETYFMVYEQKTLLEKSQGYST